MFVKIAFLIILTIYQSACFPPSNTEVASFGSPPSSGPGQTKAKLSRGYKSVIYRNLLGYVLSSMELKGGCYELIYRDSTIRAKDTDKFSKSLIADSDLSRNFLAVSQTVENSPSFDILSKPISRASGAEDLRKFFASSKAKNKNTCEVVAFSSLGIDDAHDHGLVYVESYSPDKKLTQEYLLFDLVKDTGNKEMDEIKDINRIRPIDAK